MTIIISLLFILASCAAVFPFILDSVFKNGFYTGKKMIVSIPRNNKALTKKTCPYGVSVTGKDATLYRDNTKIKVSDRREHYQHRIYLKFMHGDQFKQNIVFQT